MRTKLFLLFLFSIGLFTYFSYTVAKERWTQRDFDTTVKLQDHIPRKFDKYFSYFSLLGSVEVTVGFCLIMVVLSAIRLKWLAILGWLMIIPASMGEVFGKLILFHPAPPVFLHRSVLPTNLPSFYVHTDFSYPSGHMTRTIFIVAVFLSMIIFQSKNPGMRFISVLCLIGFAFMMGLTRVYLGEHWTSDVIGGSLLGAGVGFLGSMLILKSKKFKIAADAQEMI